MRDAVVMWREPRMVVLSAVCAAIYVAALLPFKFLVIFPGLAEVRPAAALPVVFSFLFGPAGAWGSAFGNVIADVMGGMFGPGSLFGFVGNFLYGYLPYKLWRALFRQAEVTDELMTWQTRISGRIRLVRFLGLAFAGVLLLISAVFFVGQFSELFDVTKFFNGSRKMEPAAALALFCLPPLFLAFLILALISPRRLIGVVLLASMACAGIIGWGIDLLGYLPFKVLASWILMNNLAVNLVLLPSLIPLLYPRVQMRFILFSDLMESKPIRTRWDRLSAIMVIAGVGGLFLGGMLAGPEQLEVLVGSGSQGVRGLVFSPFVLMIIIGTIGL
jgi:hypothetical protein